MDTNVVEGPVMGLFCEDDIDQIHRRQLGINQLYGLDLRAQENMYFMARPAQDNVLMEFDGKNPNGIKTKIWHALREQVGDIKPVMLTVDTAADTFGGNEIDRQQVRRYIQGCLTALSLEFGLALALLAHPSASGQANGTGTGGSTAWHNTVRCRWFIYHNAEKGCITLVLMKNNYGTKGMEIDFKHNGMGFHPHGNAEIDTFVQAKRFEHDSEWVREKITYCFERGINISMHPRANYYAKQIMKLAIQDGYDITHEKIESIVYGMDKKGQIEHKKRGNRSSTGSSFVIKGTK